MNYLWPLLIVLFSALLPGERLAPQHIVGALLGLAGTVLLFAGNTGGGFAPGQMPGLAAALVAAFVWATYSVLSRAEGGADRRRRGLLPRDRAARALVHLLVETTVWPERRGTGWPSSRSASARWEPRSLSGTSA